MAFDPFAHTPDIEPDVVFYETPKQGLTARPGEVLLRLSRDYEALIDEADLPLLQGRRFYAHQSRCGVYARNRALGFLHQLVCQAKPGLVVDHLNRNTLDCRRDNLRVAGFSHNMQNRDMPASACGFRGVSCDRGRWRARIQLDGGERSLGSYPTPEEAARAYDAAALTIYGPFAWTNFKRDLSPAVPEQALAICDPPF